MKEFKLNKELLFHTVFVCICSLVSAPILAYALGDFFQFNFSWIIGLYTIACVPTTLSSGIVIAAQSGGNRSVAVFITIVMNLIGVFILPYSMGFLLQNQAQIEFNSFEVMIDLCIKVILPFSLGFLFKKLSNEKHKFGNILPSSIVILIVLYSSSKSNSLLMSSSFTDLFNSAMASLVLHASIFIVIIGYTKLFRVGTAIKRSLLFCGSQKTLPLSIVVLAGMNFETGQAIVLCICFHFIQLLLDSFLATYIKNKSHLSFL